MVEDSRSYPFSAGSGASVSERDWGDMAQDWGHHSGVRPPGPYADPNSLAVRQNDSASVAVAPGRAKIAGYHYRLISEHTMPLPLFDSANRDRIDYVAPTVDATQPVDPGSFIEMRFRSGSEASPGSAVAPSDVQLWDAHTDTPGLWDLPLARVRSTAGDPVTEDGTQVGYRPRIVSIEDVRRYQGSDVLYMPDASAMPVNPSDGQLAYRSDLSRLYAYEHRQNSWRMISQMGQAVTYKPQVSGLSSGYTATGRYIRLADKLCWFSIHIVASRRVTPNSNENVRLYLPQMPVSVSGFVNPITFHQFSGDDDGRNSVNMMSGNALVRNGGYLNLYAPDPGDNHANAWEFDAMNRSNPGTCLLERSGAYMSVSGVYEIR